MTDQRLRDLLEERVADTPPVDLASPAWARAADVRRRRRTVAGVVVAVVAVVAGATVVATGRGDEPSLPPATGPTDSGPTPGAERAGRYGKAEVWWAPSVADEADLPGLAGTGLPPEIDLSTVEPVPAGVRAVALAQLWGDEPGGVVVVGDDGASYSLAIGFDALTVGGDAVPPVTQESLSPDGRHAFFAQDRWLEVYDFEAAEWTRIELPEGAQPAGATWEGDRIKVPTEAVDPVYELYGPDGSHHGRSFTPDIYAGLLPSDEVYGPVARLGSVGARGLFLGGPVPDPDGVPMSSVDALGAGGTDRPEALLAFPRSGSDEGRWLQCCPPVGWLDEETVLFESRHADARVLAWRVGTPELYRVSDIRGWTAGDEMYVASFADVGARLDDVDAGNGDDVEASRADAVVDGVPVWWSPDLAGERELPWLENAVLPRELDVKTEAATAPILTPGSEAPPAVAALPYPTPQDPTWIVLVARDGSIRRLSVASELVTRRDVNAPFDIATREMLSPDGRHLVFVQPRSIQMVDVTTGEWSFWDAERPPPYVHWVDDGHVLLTGEGETEGALYSLERGRTSTDAGAAPVDPFAEVADAYPDEGPWKVGPERAEAATWAGGLRLPAPGEGDGRYLSMPRYLTVTSGSGSHALAFIEAVDDERSVIGPFAAGWLDEETLVYESIAADETHVLVAWRIGTREFWKVSEFVPGNSGTFFGGPSFADLWRG